MRSCDCNVENYCMKHTVCLCMLHTVSLTICILCKHCAVVSKQSIPLVFPSKPPNLCVCVCVCACLYAPVGIYLSSVIVTTVSSGTLACSTVALSLCGVKCVCVCVCVCVFPLTGDCTICSLKFRIYLWITHICCPQLLRLQITIHTNTLPPPQHSAPRVCVCVFTYQFCGKHSHRSIHWWSHAHTHSWGYVQAGDVIITAAKLFWLTVWFPDRRASVVNRGRGPALLVQL